MKLSKKYLISVVICVLCSCIFSILLKGISFSVALIVAGFIVLIFGNGIQPQRGGMPSRYSGLKRNDNLFLSANKMEGRYKKTNSDMTIALAGLTCIVAGLVLLYA